MELGGGPELGWRSGVRWRSKVGVEEWRSGGVEEWRKAEKRRSGGV